MPLEDGITFARDTKYNRIVYENISCESASMYPLFTCEDTLVAKNVIKPSDIKEGDVVGFSWHDENRIIIHEIIKIEGGEYYTKGINNFYIDPYRLRFENIDTKIVGILLN